MQESDIDHILDESVSRQNAGDLQSAEIGYRRVLEAVPRHGEASQLLGTLKLQQGDLDSAKTYLKDAIDTDPDEPVAWLNLAGLFLKSGEPQEAHKHARKAVELAPNHPAPWKQLALSAARTGDLEAEISAMERILGWEPENHVSRVRLAELQALSGNDMLAQQALDPLTRAEGVSEKVFARALNLALACSYLVVAYMLAEAWLKGYPESEAAREKMSEAYLEAGIVLKALAAYEPLLAGAAEAPDRWMKYGRMCMIAQDFDKAEGYLIRAVEATPDSPRATFGMARLMTFKGDLEEAEAYCRRSMEIDDGYSPAYMQLTILRSGDIDDETLAHMEHLWEQAALREESKANLGFSIGDIYQKRSNFDRAFEFYEAANRLNRDFYAKSGAVYDRDKQASVVDLLIGDAAPGSENKEPKSEFRPIFVIGMPRSGTTLTENILAAHPEVHGCGELLNGSHALGEYLYLREQNPGQSIDDIVSRKAAAWRAGFEEKFENPSGTRLVTDKLPVNFLSVGLLARIFPHARFVHVSRDLLDCGLSIYRHSFSRSYEFSHRLEDIGDYMLHYQRLMAHWREVMDHRLIEVDYAKLVANPNSQIHNLVEKVGLEWDEACLNFHKSRRTVATFSMVQVRQPISRKMSGDGEKYGRHLAPLKEVLERS
jgi:tetratricopeptide (TPR) repeat protein